MRSRSCHIAQAQCSRSFRRQQRWPLQGYNATSYILLCLSTPKVAWKTSFGARSDELPSTQDEDTEEEEGALNADHLQQASDALPVEKPRWLHFLRLHLLGCLLLTCFL